MELSAVVMKYGLRLSRPESRLVSLLPDGASERIEQRIKKAAAARDALQQLPDRQTSEQHGRMEKAAMLKERLKMLRQSLPFLNAAAVKALQTEMKQIAAQLATLGEGSAGGSGVMAAAETPVVGPSTAGPNAEAPPEAAAAEQEAGSSGQEKHALPGTTAPEAGMKSNTAATAEERQLQETVAELRGLYKAVREALKRKLQTGHDIARIPGAAYLRAYATAPVKEGRVTFNV